MTLHDIQYHIEGYGCNLDPLGDGDGSYFASNCISGDNCIIEDLPFYSNTTLCHYFYELSVPVPTDLREAYDAYCSIREYIKSIGELEPVRNAESSEEDE